MLEQLANLKARTMNLLGDLSMIKIEQRESNINRDPTTMAPPVRA
jgi:hypothetical protein